MPPVVETVLAVQFKPLPKLAKVQLSLFWSRYREEWPEVREAVPLPRQSEQFGDAQRWARIGMQLGFAAPPIPTRLQLIGKDGARMLQLQNGALCYNWVGGQERAYPRYHETRAAFDAWLGQFRAFLREETLGELEADQWEVTYVNRIPKGTVWNEPTDWGRLFSNLLVFPPSEAVPMVLESVSSEWHFVIPEQRGRLHVQLQHGREENPGNREILILKLTARGPIKAEGPESQRLGEGLDLGHEVIVRSFAALTSPDAHRYWRKCQ